ncbi:HEPN domain-containing protein [Microbacterium maritypicum]|uniref:HEPN domain-containing protein n=1 Tax=Microbacterium maritypicum TaxID=33918 RepID=UPI00296E69DA|nr:HEPN domain-containing protein [Microbacterium liquefaciens]
MANNDDEGTARRLESMASALRKAANQFLPPVDDATRRKDDVAVACFMCHLTIEQGIKAVLCTFGEQPPRTIHDLKKLLSDVVGPQQELLAAALDDIALNDVTLWSFAGRYMHHMEPGVEERLTSPAFIAALFQATLRLSLIVVEIFDGHKLERSLSEVNKAIATYEQATYVERA